MARKRCCCWCDAVGGWLHVAITAVNVVACAVFIAFAIKCSVVHGNPVELCHDALVAYDAANDIVLGVLFGVHIVCAVMLLWLCRGISVGIVRHIRRTVADPGARLYEASMWAVTVAMVAYLWWALGSERVYLMAGLITVSVLCNTATTSYIAPVDLSKRPDAYDVGDAGGGGTRGEYDHGDGDDDGDSGFGCDCCGSSARVSARPAGVVVVENRGETCSLCEGTGAYSDDDGFFSDYCTSCSAHAVESGLPPSLMRRSRPRPGRLRTAAMRTLMLNIFLHNGVLFLYDITSMLARLDDLEMSPMLRRTLVLANLASVWYRGGQALFYYFKYNFAWRNVMIPQFESASIVPSQS